MNSLNIAEELNVAAPEHADAKTAHLTRPFLWSIRRELWENPSIIVAPVAVASLLILAVLFAAVRFTTSQLLVELGPDKTSLSNVAVLPLLPVPIVLGVAMIGVAILYSLDALLSERRDRTILFWKSLPVSDTTTVLSKMAVPTVILPIATFVLSIATQIVIFVIANVALLIHHASVSAAWAGTPILPLLGLMAYGATVVTLWYAPIYAWCLLVSAWARRAALLWAVIPFFLLSVFERIAFHTHHVRDFINNRLVGVFLIAFSNNHRMHGLEEFLDWTPGHFLATPALWFGLLFTALALILMIRLRRSADPI